MGRLCRFRSARLAFAALCVISIAGCPELNQWSGPAQDPLFSVDDPVPPPRLQARWETPVQQRGAPGPGASSAVTPP